MPVSHVSHSLNFLGMCSCSALPQREICTHWTLLCQCRRASLFFSSLGIWQAASCTLYTWPATGHLVFTAPEEMKLAAQQVTTIHGCAPELGIPGQNITPGQCPLIFTQVS